MSSTGFTQPPPAAVTGTTSTLTDSVFLSGSGSSRKNLTCKIYCSQAHIHRNLIAMHHSPMSAKQTYAALRLFMVEVARNMTKFGPFN